MHRGHARPTSGVGRGTTVSRMPPLSEEDLRRSTLGRQFPEIAGRDATAVLDLFHRLGPIQSQVPRSPFLAAASRLPGVSYATMTELFTTHQLLKTSNLRGTVHTSVRDQFALADAVARQVRAPTIRRHLGLVATTPEEVVAEVERLTGDQWRSRTEMVSHIRAWLAERDPDATIADTSAENLVWGHSSLIRRPRDRRWERRTDVYHRLASALLPELERPDPAAALAALVRVHLGAYGPVVRDDLAFFTGTGLRAVDAAVRALGAEVVHRAGPDGEDYLDLADPPPAGREDPGLRLLPEFDGLLVGLHGRHRTRFLTAEQLGKVWAKANGLLSPVVLDEGRIVASWRTRPAGRERSAVEVQMLAPYRRLTEDRFDAPVTALEQVLDLRVGDVRVLPA